jgi:hypothetical protein
MSLSEDDDVIMSFAPASARVIFYVQNNLTTYIVGPILRFEKSEGERVGSLQDMKRVNAMNLPQGNLMDEIY